MLLFRHFVIPVIPLFCHSVIRAFCNSFLVVFRYSIIPRTLCYYRVILLYFDSAVPLFRYSVVLGTPKRFYPSSVLVLFIIPGSRCLFISLFDYSVIP